MRQYKDYSKEELILELESRFDHRTKRWEEKRVEALNIVNSKLEKLNFALGTLKASDGRLSSMDEQILDLVVTTLTDFKDTLHDIRNKINGFVE